MKLIKAIISLLCLIGLCLGIILIATDVPDNASVGTILLVNGGGVAIFCISLLLLAHLNGNTNEEYEQKGDKYYGL